MESTVSIPPASCTDCKRLCRGVTKPLRVVGGSWWLVWLSWCRIDGHSLPRLHLHLPAPAWSVAYTPILHAHTPRFLSSATIAALQHRQGYQLAVRTISVRPSHHAALAAADQQPPHFLLPTQSGIAPRVIATDRLDVTPQPPHIPSRLQLVSYVDSY